MITLHKKSGKLIYQYLLPTVVIVSLSASCTPSVSTDERPNIVYIMVDDLGYADLSSYGREDYQTPVIDALINEGMKFTQAYSAAPICSPTRVGLMTGRYPARYEIGLREPLSIKDTLALPIEIETLSSMIKSSGYETAIFGKWHLGITAESTPIKHGFNEFFGISSGGADYIKHVYYGDEPVLYENEELVEKQGYLTDLITDYTIEFIKREHEKPFFINLEYTAPHWPWQVPGDKPYPYTENWEDYVAGGSDAKYAGMVQNLDANIARIMQSLKESNLDESTVVIFTSDNGGEKFSNMGPFQGQKGSLYEGGIRVPAAVRWPGKIKAGTETDQVVITMDWTVTMLEIAKAQIPNDLNFDGISMVDHLMGNKPKIDRQILWRFGKQGAENLQNAYRDGDWKYLKMSNREFLFDLKNDLGETIDVKDNHPEIFRQLANRFKAIDSQMLDRLITSD